MDVLFFFAELARRHRPTQVCVRGYCHSNLPIGKSIMLEHRGHTSPSLSLELTVLSSANILLHEYDHQCVILLHVLLQQRTQLYH